MCASVFAALAARFDYPTSCAGLPTRSSSGKAERFIRTLLAGWAYGAIYATSTERTAALHGWLWTYNHQRPHGALSHKPPIDHLNKLNNLPGSYN
jgi:transposase InsO family protein